MKRRLGITLAEVLVCVAILATLCGLLAPAFMAARASREKTTAEPPTTIQMVTVQHDGHWWVLCREHFAHHPDCPCRSRQPERQER